MSLTPAPSTLGLHSPELGPWFDSDDSSATLPTLPAPGEELSVAVSLADEVDWRAPTHGTRRFLVADDPRPTGLAGYRNAAGDPAFTTGNVVVLFELWPDAEVRLDALTATLPRPDGSTGTDVPTRPRVHALAMEFPAASLSVLEALHEGFPNNVSTDAEKLAYLGLAVDSAGGLTSAEVANPELRMVGEDTSVLVQNRSTAELAATLWAFDQRGRPIDPGAVAAWWERLATTDWDNLWSSTDAAEQRTAAVEAANTVHLVDAHEGPLSSAHLAQLTPSNLTTIGAATNLFSAATAAGGTAPSFALADPPTPDDAPIPRLALLPYGAYGTIGAPDNAGTTVLSGWPSSATPALDRDFVRLAFVDVEAHLVGLDRTDTTQADVDLRLTPAVNTAEDPFRASADAAHAAVLDVLGDSGVVMSPVADVDWGAAVPAALTAGTIEGIEPASFATVFALAGEGRAEGDTAADQQVVVRLDGLPADAWVRVWPHGFDTTTGYRFRATGGGGRAGDDGTAHVVMAIADGATGRLMTMDVLVVTADDREYLGGVRFERPDLVAGAAVALAEDGAALTDATAWICEQGVALDRDAGNLRSGDTLLAVPDDPDTGTFHLVDPDSIAAADRVDETLIAAVADGDTVVVTEPAFAGTEEGSVGSTTASVGAASVVVKRRILSTGGGQLDDFDDWVGLGNPIPSMERREVAGADEASDIAALGTAPGRAANHEAPPAQYGHPGVRAADESHGTGVALAGPAAHRPFELLRERAAPDLETFLTSAAEAATAASGPTGAGPRTWAAVLETIATGGAGDPALRAFVAAFPNFAPGDTWEGIRTAIEGAVRSIPGQGGFQLLPTLGASLTTGQATQLARAVDRLLITVRDGRHQAATAMQAAIGRAQDLVYLETPAIDELTAAGGDIDLVGALVDRLAAVPSLRVIVCAPKRFVGGQPTKLEGLRRDGVNGALHTLQAAGGERVAWFAPIAGPGRDLHMSSTTVVVDDAVLITGTTHLWRRGLTFDSSLAAALFDEQVTAGRPRLVRAARRRLLADRLGIDEPLVSDDPAAIASAARRLAQRGGLGRVDPAAYAPTARTADPTDDVWLPDGTAATDWLVALAALLAQTDGDTDDFIR